ncbi:MAG: exopolyphosphatase, partial [Acidimicrobiia bacterium]|nr:exopolyphosphatase [Acidimicrobiia bacterium]
MTDQEAPLAAIDLGTNSFHLVVARPTGNNRFDILDREKEVVRLGSGSGDMKRLAPDAMDRGISALTRFRRLVDAAGAELHAVATSAVREAENRDEFLDRARDEAGVTVEVVSGVEEARLIHLGVLQAVPVYDERILVIDIGGGSVEFIIGAAGGEFVEARSLKLGAIRMTERFFADEPVRKRDLAEARRYIRAALTPAVRLVAD